MENNQNNKEIMLDDLAIMVKKGFDETHEQINGLENRFDGLENRFDGLENRFDGLEKKVDDGFLNVNARLDRIEQDIKHFVTMDEFEDLMVRVKYIETKLGIESGK